MRRVSRGFLCVWTCFFFACNSLKINLFTIKNATKDKKSVDMVSFWCNYTPVERNNHHNKQYEIKDTN